jgi:thiol-disulfide isomerase/thioredoxin
MEKKYKCRLCGREFYSSHGLKAHVKDEHPFRYYFPRIILPAILCLILVVGLTFALITKTTITATVTPGTEQAYRTAETSIAASTTTTTLTRTSIEYPKAPSFQLREYGSGRNVTLEEFKGKPVFLEFFSPYCPHCLNMMPKVEQLYEKYGDRLPFIMVSYGEKGVGEVKEKYGLRTMILVDDGKVFRDYGVEGVPTFLILDREHRIVWRKAGEMDIQEFESAIQRVL